MLKIVVMPVKNEEWILEKSLTAASLWADHIVVADQQSTDATAEICQRFSKVTRITNDCTELDQSYARQLLLTTVRQKFGTDTIIAALDADEVFSANVLNDKGFENCINELPPGGSVELQWVMLWGSPWRYRDDASVWSNNWKHFVFRDDGLFNFAHEKTSEPRMPVGYMKHTRRYEAVKVLHYQFVDRERMLAKQRRYQVEDYVVRPTFWRALAINRMYFEAKNARSVRCASVPEQWWSGYPSNLSEEVSQETAIFWYDREVLARISEFGPKYFAWLDIWDTDWNKKISLMPEQSDDVLKKIVEPRCFVIKMYHRFLQRPLSRLVDIKNRLKKYSSFF